MSTSQSQGCFTHSFFAPPQARQAQKAGKMRLAAKILGQKVKISAIHPHFSWAKEENFDRTLKFLGQNLVDWIKVRNFASL